MESPPFTFRLERLRSVRERMEEQRREEFAASLALRLRGQGMLDAAHAELENAKSVSRSTGTHAVVRGTDLIAAQAWVEAAERRRQARELDLERHDTEVQARRDALQQASQDRQALERLKDKRRQEHNIEAQRIAAVALDEMALNMHRRAQEAA